MVLWLAYIVFFFGVWFVFALWLVYFLLFILLDTSREIEGERARTIRNNLIFGAVVLSLAIASFLGGLPLP